MDRGQVQAIQHLVAAAVASPDARPRRHRRRSRQSSGRRRRQVRRRRRWPATRTRDTTNYEDRLRQRVESIVASVVGAGHVRVQVAADMNYNHTQHHRGKLRSRQQGGALDPDGGAECQRHHRRRRRGRVGRQRPARRRPARRRGDAGKSTSGRTEETTNYEISKTVTTSHRGWRRREEAVGRGGGGRHRRHAASLQAAQRRRNGQDHRPGEIGDGLRRRRAATRCRSPTWNSPASKPATPPRRPSRCWAWTAPTGSRSSKPRSCASPRC